MVVIFEFLADLANLYVGTELLIKWDQSVTGLYRRRAVVQQDLYAAVTTAPDQFF